MNDPKTVAIFLKDVADHKLTVLRDDGLYRHLRFKSPDCGCFRFDLITYPGGLLYTGDMGTFVFERTADMLEFFRKGQTTWEEKVRHIDRAYWAEKVRASDRDGVMEYSPDLFRVKALHRLVEWVKSNRDRVSKEDRRTVWEDAMEQVIGRADDVEHGAIGAALDFRCLGRSPFADFWEVNCKVYTLRFSWCCLALVWGIDLYDAHKTAQAAAAAVPA